MNPSCIALIPARSGSKRLPDKNIRPLAGHPLLAYAIASARDSGVFAAVVVSTDSEEYARIARHYGAEVPGLRPPALSGDKSPDIEWVDFVLRQMQSVGRTVDCFSILRPTSPFRQPETIRRAWQAFLADPAIDSLRAVERCQQHPGKMWLVRGGRLLPLLGPAVRTAVFGDVATPANVPWHSCQYAALPDVWVQNASLEIAWTRVVFEGRTIAGDVILPFMTAGHEGVDVNRPYDWEYAETLVRRGEAQLPTVTVSPYAP